MADSAHFVKSTPPRVFGVALIICMYVTEILNICMWKYDDDKIIFDKFTAFLT